MDQWEREEKELYTAYERGDIDRETLDHELDNLWRDYRAAAQEAADHAYDDEMQRW